MDAWLDIFMQAVDNHVPIKQQRVQHKNQPQWMSPEILEAMKFRDRHKALGNENEYKAREIKLLNLSKILKKFNTKHSLIIIKATQAVFTKYFGR